MTNGNFDMEEEDEPKKEKAKKKMHKKTKSKAKSHAHSQVVEKKDDEVLSFNLLVQKIRWRHMINAILSDDPDKK